MKINILKIPEDLKPIIEVAPAELQVGKVEEVDLSTYPPGEQWKFLLRGAELGVLLAGMGRGIISIGDGHNNKTLAPYEALPLAYEGTKLIERLRNLSDEYHSLSSVAWPAKHRKALNNILKKLDQSFDALLDSEKRLHSFGWKFDQKAGNVKRIDKHEGKDLFAEVVWGVYQAKYVRKGHKGPGPTLEVRQGIAKILATNYPASKLGTGTHAPIYRAIYNREYRKL